MTIGWKSVVQSQLFPSLQILICRYHMDSACSHLYGYRPRKIPICKSHMWIINSYFHTRTCRKDRETCAECVCAHLFTLTAWRICTDERASVAEPRKRGTVFSTVSGVVAPFVRDRASTKNGWLWFIVVAVCVCVRSSTNRYVLRISIVPRIYLFQSRIEMPVGFVFWNGILLPRRYNYSFKCHNYCAITHANYDKAHGY